MTGSGFFNVARDTFVRACDRGINPAAAFLVLARGSGGDNVTTRWSAEAIANRLGMRWGKAKEAVAELAATGLVAVEKASTKPIYKLAHDGGAIWLPNAIVDGVGAEVAPVLRLRQTQDAMALRLFIELYGQQNLCEDGGVSPSLIRWKYERERIGERGPWVVWRFHSGHEVAWTRKETLEPHVVRRYDKRRKVSEVDATEFFRRIGLLATLGLFEWVPYLFDGPDGEPIHPLNWKGTIQEEIDLYRACDVAARRCLTDGQAKHAAKKGGFLAPVRAHMEQVQLIGVARLRYRPRTSLTGAWFAEHTEMCRMYANHYATVAVENVATPTRGRDAA